MAAWSIVVMLILAVAIGLFIFLTISTESGNRKRQQANILYPFSGYLPPPGPPWSVNKSQNNPGIGKTPEDGLFLVGMKGGETSLSPQIQCPAGYKINIVGAFVDIVDPHGECSNTSNSTLRLTCGDSSDRTSAATCNSVDDCAEGMSCIGGRCVPQQCSVNSDCGGSTAKRTANVCAVDFGKDCSVDADCDSPDGSLKCVSKPSGNGKYCAVDPGVTSCLACIDPKTGLPPAGNNPGFCAAMPVCMGVENGFNVTCSPSKGDRYKCRPRDASAYLAAHCDGKQTCLGNPSDKWDPNLQEGVFGPLPCQIPAVSGNTPYATLPAITGWGGGTPNDGAKAPEPVTFSLGYKVHGIYTCIPDDENAVTK
ncbi:MAG: hypothetical protein R3213_10215 [Flavobacteriaceae bacterium]|nr:hypothetical protein [Flavobacteriaceae bacterium]